MTKVCVLDYGSGNVKSVFNLLSSIVDTEVSNDPAVMDAATHIVLPGVGAFGAAMRRIRQTIPIPVLERIVLEEKKPFLGVCVGMQVLADRGTEFGEHEGLGWIAGSVDKLDPGTLPLPHIGWNNIQLRTPHPLLNGLENDPDFYYVHSFVFHAKDPDAIVATTDFGETFAAVVQRDNICGVQFHPEKSQRAGIRLARNFLEMT